MIYHPLDIDRYRIDADLEFEAETGHAIRSLYGLPMILVHLHEIKERSDNLHHHGTEIASRILRIMNLSAEKRFAQTESFADGCSRHPDVDSKPRDIRIPDVLGEI